jgi:hypothetical protein
MICDNYRGKNTGPQCVKVGLKEVGCGALDWVELAQDRDMWQGVVIVIMNIRVP